MYNIDSRGLKTSIGMLLFPRTEQSQLEEQVAYYFPLVLNMIVEIMNNDTKHVEDAVNEELLRYRDDVDLQFFYELIYNEVRAIKKQFIMAGFDHRLKYKLMVREVPRTTIKMYGIGMDLDLTFAGFYPHDESGESDGSEVIEHPTAEDLERYFDRSVRQG